MRTILVILHLSWGVKAPEVKAANRMILRTVEYPTDLGDKNQGLTYGMPDYRTGLADKQDVASLESLAELTGYPASDILYIDDRCENIKAANEVGLHTLKYENLTQLETVMRETYGFKFEPEVPQHSG